MEKAYSDNDALVFSLSVFYRVFSCFFTLGKKTKTGGGNGRNRYPLVTMNHLQFYASPFLNHGFFHSVWLFVPEI